MTLLFMQKDREHWLSIYQIAVFRGREVKSLWDLINYSKIIMPESPRDCLKIGLELIEAQKTVPEKPFNQMLESFAYASKAEIDQEKYGVSII